MESGLVACAVTSYGYQILVEDCEAYRQDLNWLVLCNRVEEALLAIFIAVQMSTVGFLLVHGRKEKTFRQAFYVFFVAVTVADCLLVIAVSVGLLGRRRGEGTRNVKALEVRPELRVLTRIQGQDQALYVTRKGLGTPLSFTRDRTFALLMGLA